MSKAHADEMAVEMADRLGIPVEAGEAFDARLAAAVGLVAGHLIKLADGMDAAGFPQVADALDRTLRDMRGIVRSASAYEEFKREIEAVPMGDCRAVAGVYRRFANMLEAEDAFMKARQDCKRKCPSFQPMI